MLVPYTKTVWKNGQAPARNDTNLNNQENGIFEVTEETILQAQQILDLATPINIDYVPQVAPPAYLEGRVFYDDNSHTLSLYNDISDMTLNLGLETIARCFNNTGVTIPNGTPVYVTGTVGGVPTVAPAIATSFATAIAGGVTTHDIEDQTEGFTTIVGTVSDVDLTGFTAGERLYLSDTVAGGYVTLAPDIATYIGTVMVSGIAGKLLVKTTWLINLPTVSAYMQDLNTPAVAISATPTKFADFTVSEGIVLEGDPINGLFTVDRAGYYEIKTSFAISGITSSNNAQYIDIHMRVNESAVNERIFPLTIGRNGAETSGTPFFEIELLAGETVSIWHSSPQITDTVDVNTITFSLTSLYIRN